MKKLILIVGSLFFLPAFASCPIDEGVCTASNWDSGTLQEKYAPNSLDNYNRTDAFRPTYVVPYYDLLINKGSSKQIIESNDYNSNCQFGICLPSVQPGGDIIE